MNIPEDLLGLRSFVEAAVGPIEHLSRSAGGASRITWFIEAAKRACVLRVDPGDGPDRDGDVFAADLTITGLSENFVPIATPERGHWDQPTTVQGWLELHGNRMELDCLGMRDRSWGARLDDVSARASYVYGLSRGSSFLVVTQHTANGPVSMGFLERDGHRAVLATADVDEQRDARNRVTVARIRAEDAQGRTLETQGVAKNHLAKTASPGFFAWMTMMEWDIGARGQFQDVWSPDQLSTLAQRNRPL